MGHRLADYKEGLDVCGPSVREHGMKTVPVFLGGLLIVAVVALAQNNESSLDSQRALVNQYCAGCHNDKLKSGGFSWSQIDLGRPELTVRQAERVIRKIRSGMMPPAGARRPDETSLKSFASAIENRIDEVAAKQTHID